MKQIYTHGSRKSGALLPSLVDMEIIPAGRSVLLQGLQNASHLNGEFAKVVDFKTHSHRYEVKVLRSAAQRRHEVSEARSLL
eukprot:7583679-Karenia_brevis.AAC.1